MKTTLVSLAALLALVPLAFGSAAPRPGSLDPSFGRGGKVLTAAGSGITGLVREPNGKVVAAGGALVRYNPDGSLDASFGALGIVALPNFFATAVGLQPDGKLVAVSWFGTVEVARFLSNGSLDPSFGVGGISTPVPGGWTPALAVQRDGKIVVTTGGEDFVLYRFQADGLPDRSFGTDGVVTTDFGGADFPRAVALQADGKIVVGGTSCSGPEACDTGNPGVSVLARYNADGSLDPSFGSFGYGGKVILSQEGVTDQEGVSDVAVDADGKILAAGAGSDGLVRLNQDGSLDRTFATVEDASAVAVRRNGSILVASLGGHNGFAVARLRPNGSLDPSFGSGGRVETHFGFLDLPNAILLEPHGRALVGGYDNSRDGSTSRFALARYFDGTLYCVVPSVKGKELAAARRAIRRAQCSVGQVKRAFSPTVKKGLVTSQKPTAGTRRPFHAKVNLTVSSGERR